MRAILACACTLVLLHGPATPQNQTPEAPAGSAFAIKPLAHLADAVRDCDNAFLFGTHAGLYLSATKEKRTTLWLVNETGLIPVTTPTGKPLAGARVDPWHYTQCGLISFAETLDEVRDTDLDVFVLEGAKTAALKGPNGEAFRHSISDSMSVQPFGKTVLVYSWSKKEKFELFVMQANRLSPLVGLDGNPIGDDLPMWTQGLDGELYAWDPTEEEVDIFNLKLDGTRLGKTGTPVRPDSLIDAKLSISRLPTPKGTLVRGVDHADSKCHLWQVLDGKALPVLDSAGLELGYAAFHLLAMRGAAYIVGRNAIGGNLECLELFAFENGRAKSLGKVETACSALRLVPPDSPLMICVESDKGVRSWFVPQEGKLVLVRNSDGSVFDPGKRSYAWDQSRQLMHDLDVDAAPVAKLEGDRLHWLMHEKKPVRHDLPIETVGPHPIVTLILRKENSPVWESAKLVVVGSSGAVHALSAADGPLEGNHINSANYGGRLWVLVLLPKKQCRAYVISE